MLEAQFDEAERLHDVTLYTTAPVKPLQVFLVHKNKFPFTKSLIPSLPFSINTQKHKHFYILAGWDRRIVVNLQGED